MYRNRLQAAGLFMLGLSSACSDLPSSALEPRDDIEKSVFGCGLAVRTDERLHTYRFIRALYTAPASIGQVANGSVRFVVKYGDPGKYPKETAVCMIPKTPEALEYAQRLFLPKEALTKRAGGASFDLAAVHVTAPYTYSFAEAFGWIDTGIYTGSFPWTSDSNYNWYYDPNTDPEMDGATCDPNYTVGCEQPLLDKDKVLLNALITERFKDPNTLPFPNNLACGAMIDKAKQMLASGQVKRGLSDTKDGDVGIKAHFGAYNEQSGNMHIDPAWLDDASGNYARAELANTLLHEAAHALGEQHPDDDGWALEIPGYGTTYVYQHTYNNYFTALNFGNNSCINFFNH